MYLFSSLARWGIVALVAVCAASVTGCTIESGKQIPKRPGNVSMEAAWIGGPDGGVWVELRADRSAAGLYFAKIQFETGALAYEGPLQREPASTQPVDTTMVEAWDGDELLLSGGGSLRKPPASPPR